MDMDEKKVRLFKTIGKNIKNVREEKGITRKEVSEKINIRKEYLKKIENGECSGLTADHLFKIANALNVEAKDLV